MKLRFSRRVSRRAMEASSAVEAGGHLARSYFFQASQHLETTAGVPRRGDERPLGLNVVIVEQRVPQRH